jgi:hypothetical protein
MATPFDGSFTYPAATVSTEPVMGLFMGHMDKNIQYGSIRPKNWNCSETSSESFLCRISRKSV